MNQNAAMAACGFTWEYTNPESFGTYLAHCQLSTHKEEHKHVGNGQHEVYITHKKTNEYSSGWNTSCKEVLRLENCTYETVPGYAATCTKKGVTDKVYCTLCGYRVSNASVIPATGHTEETLNATAATCTEPGLTAGKKCSVCGTIIVAQTTVPAKGHTEENAPGYAATCTQTGFTDGKKCSSCGEILVSQELISAKGHSEVTVPGYAATETQTGLTDGKKCSVCGEVTVPQQEIPMLAHTHIEEIVPGYAATCTETGLSDGKKCSACGEVLVSQQTIAANGHSEETLPGYPATETQAGLTDGKKCSVCGEVTVPQQEIPVLSHIHIEETIPGKVATCTETGLTEGKKCSGCGEIIVAQTVIPAKSHSEVTIPGKAVTCTESGLTDGKKCSFCGEILIVQNVIPASGHTGTFYYEHDHYYHTKKWTCCSAAENRERHLVPDCSYTGITNQCTVCKADDVSCIWAVGHMPKESHWSDDTRHALICRICSRIIDGTEEPHIYNSCSDYYCQVCNHHRGNSSDSHLGKPIYVLYDNWTHVQEWSCCGMQISEQERHSVSCGNTSLCTVCGGTVPAEVFRTEKNHGSYTKKYDRDASWEVCNICGEKRNEKFHQLKCTQPDVCYQCGVSVALLNPSIAIQHWGKRTEYPYQAATCTQTGHTAATHCAGCDTYLVELKVIPAEGHIEETTPGYPATATQTGLTDGKKCSVCGEVTVPQQEIPVLSHTHTEETVPSKAATCTETGLTEGKKCSSCGEILVAQKTIAAKGHSEVTVPGYAATETQTGLTDGKKCAVCGEITVPQQEIPVLSHIHIEETIPGKAATCTETGLTEGKKCSSCGEILVSQKTIPAKGHSEEIIPGKDATNDDSGLTDGKKCADCDIIIVEQTIIPAKKHNFFGEWETNDSGSHLRYCNYGCGESVTVACDFLIADYDEATLQICPICGRFGETIIAAQKKASISNPANEKNSFFIVRAGLNPIAENAKCIAVITAVYEQNGRIATLEPSVEMMTLRIPQLTDIPCRLAMVSYDKTTHQTWFAPVAYTIENGYMVFKINQLGMFLLIAE